MKKLWLRKVICFVLALTVLCGGFSVTAAAGSGYKTNSTSSTLEEMKELTGLKTYAEYLSEHLGEAGSATLSEWMAAHVGEAQTIPVDLLGGYLTDRSGANDRPVTTVLAHAADGGICADYENWKGFGSDNAATSIYISDADSCRWQFSVDTAGFYYIAIDYYDCETNESSISSIQRKLDIDDHVPFSEASSLQFDKTWTYNNIVETTEPTTEPDGTHTEYVLKENEGDVNGSYAKIVTTVKNGVKTVRTATISQDYVGNSMAPTAVSAPSWKTYYCKDSTGYETSYFAFYFTKGDHSITLEAEREPMVVRAISLVPASEVTSATVSYAQYMEKYKDVPAAPAGNVTTIEAEFPDYVSDSSVYATNDNSSSGTYPSVAKAQLYNVIGENSYNTVGQWAAYRFSVGETGMYQLGMRYKQSSLQGMFLCRAIKLSGGEYGDTPTLPFAEASEARFDYSKEWQSAYVGNGNGSVFNFHFEAGVEYTLYLECSLGALRTNIQRVEEAMTKVNEAYLTILQYTGSEPDEYRDYGFLQNMPEVLVTLLEQAAVLEKVKDEFIALCGTNGSHIATLHTIALLLDTMGQDDGEKIAANMSTLKSYLGTLGTWINSSKTSSMVVDSITVAPAGSSTDVLPKATPGFFKSLWFEIKSFIYSFFTDYDAMGLTHKMDENTQSIEVWLATGRDQSQIWRSMIDASGGFTDSTGSAVTLKLVTGGTLLPSILSGKGPDVYLGLGAGDVINYAIRDAVLGISGNYGDLSPEQNAVFTTPYYTYKDGNSYTTTTTPRAGETPSFTTLPFADVIGSGENANYAEAAMDTVTLLDVTYGVPQTMSFAMMFYRMDVLAELNAEVPETWDELLALLPVLQANNMEIGLSYGAAIEFMIYQRGGSLWKYTDSTSYEAKYAGAKIDLDSNIAKTAFDFVCRLYSNYSFPVSYSAATRFRTGEMPIIIGDYAGFYNELVVYATEINGMWEFSSLPGSFREDSLHEGEYCYDSMAGVSATVILHGCENLLSAWQFTQWETGAKAQADYGNKMVALIGPSAKYESANLRALNNLSWTQSEYKAIADQMAHLSSVVNYPGSYIIGRYEKFAFLAAVNDGADPIDALSDYIDAINSELTRKRQEFNLPTFDKDEDPPMKSGN